MLFTPKIETVGSIKNFLERTNLVEGVKPLIPVALTVATLSTYASTVSAEGPKYSLTHAFDPLIDLVQTLAYPVGFVMICAGFLVIMTGNKSRGLHILKWAVLGYVGMQFAPGIMAILAEVGRSLGK